MNTAYEVGARFTLENMVSPQLTKIAEDMTALDRKLDKTKLSFIERVEKMAGSFNLLGPAADKASTAMLAAMDRTVGGVTRASASIRGEIDGNMFAGADLKANAAADEILAAMGRAATGASKDATTIRDAFAGAFVDLGAGLDGSVSGITAQLGRITASAGEAARSIAAIRTELATLAAVPSLNLPTGAGGAAPGGSARLGQRSSGHGRGGQPHFGRVGTEITGGHASIGGGPGLAAAGIIGFGIYEAAQMRDEVNKLMITGQVSPQEWGGKRDQLSKLLMDSASLTGFSVKQVGEALSKSERAMNGLDVNTKMDVTKALIPYAAAEAKLKDTSLAESLESMVGLAHMTGTYEPAAIADLARKFGFVSLSTNSSLPAFEKTLSYSMPILRTGMGMDPDTIMALTAAAQNSGITSTKSGTWLRSFFEGSEPETGDGDHAKNHNAALKRFGLLDDRNMPTWKVNGADGKTDWTASVAREAEILGAHLKNLPIDDRMGAVKQIWGERGGGMASMLSMGTFVDQFTTLAAKIQSFKGGEAALEEYAKDNPAQKARETWRDFENVLMDIGNTALPTVNSALQSLDVALKALPADWEATKKLWTDRVDGIFHAPKAAAEALGKIPGVGAPFRSDAKPGFDPNHAYEAGGFQPMAYHEGDGSSGGISSAEETIYRGTLRAFTDFAAGKSISGGLNAGGGGGGFMNASFGGEGFGGSGGGGGGGGGVDMGGSYGKATGVSGSFKANQLEAYTAAKANGLSENAARALVANMSGEGLAVDAHRVHWDSKHNSGGIVQWDPTRAAAIKRQFGKLPWEMSIADQTKAAIWEINTNPAYAETKAALAGGGSAASMLGPLVRNYERPGNAGKAIGERLGYLGGFDPNAAASVAGGNFSGIAGKDAVSIALGLADRGVGEGAARAALGHKMTHGEWCADFVNGVIEKAGGKGTGSSMANSFSNWGKHVDLKDAAVGDVIEELHGNRIGHAGMVAEVRKDANGQVTGIRMVSGNYGNQVKTNWEPFSKIGDLRRGASSVQAAPKQPDVSHIEVKSILDGKQVSHTVVKHMAKNMRFPRATGGPSHHDFYTSPGTPMLDSA